jgi:hypothetical protein
MINYQELNQEAEQDIRYHNDVGPRSPRSLSSARTCGSVNDDPNATALNEAGAAL